MTIALVVLGVVVYLGIGYAFAADGDSRTGDPIMAAALGFIWPICAVAIIAHPAVKRLTRRLQQ